VFRVSGDFWGFLGFFDIQKKKHKKKHKKIAKKITKKIKIKNKFSKKQTQILNRLYYGRCRDNSSSPQPITLLFYTAIFTLTVIPKHC